MDLIRNNEKLIHIIVKITLPSASKSLGDKLEEKVLLFGLDILEYQLKNSYFVIVIL